MMKPVLLSVAAFALCAAQEVVPIIHLSSEETAKARQIAQDLKSAQDRDTRAGTAWQNFNQSYQAAHPGWPLLRFAVDFHVALARKASNDPLGELDAIELSADEGQQAESIYRETLEAKRGLEQARKNWRGFQFDVVANHNSDRSGGPNPWYNGAAFTPDFRIAVPRQ